MPVRPPLYKNLFNLKFETGSYFVKSITKILYSSACKISQLSRSSFETYVPYNSNCNVIVCRFYIRNKLNTSNSLSLFIDTLFSLQSPSNARVILWLFAYLSQLHEQFKSSITLVKFNWYCESGGDNDKVLTWGRELINLSDFFPKDVYRRSLFFFLAFRARSHSLSLASLARSPMFSKRTKRKIKQRLCTGYNSLSYYVFFFLQTIRTYLGTLC